ncbi:MAG: nucleoside deaminase [Deltaproteobacteria bacterium]|nr:nucleoside deaminase [Deltaproteobacteria bacterium]
MSSELYKKFFKAALVEAGKAFKKNEVPIGAVVVKNEKIIARAHNLTEKKGNFLAHAEILCIEKAAKKLKTKYLKDCEIFITLEPCRMCEAAASLSRIESIHYLIGSEKFGASGKAYKQISLSEQKLESSEESRKLLQDFFKKKRYAKKR